MVRAMSSIGNDLHLSSLIQIFQVFKTHVGDGVKCINAGLILTLQCASNKRRYNICKRYLSLISKGFEVHEDKATCMRKSRFLLTTTSLHNKFLYFVYYLVNIYVHTTSNVYSILPAFAIGITRLMDFMVRQFVINPCQFLLLRPFTLICSFARKEQITDANY